MHRWLYAKLTTIFCTMVFMPHFWKLLWYVMECYNCPISLLRNIAPHMDVQHWLVTNKLRGVQLNQVLNTTTCLSVGHFDNIRKTSSLQVNCITRYMLSLMGWTKKLCLLLIWCEILHVWSCQPCMVGVNPNVNLCQKSFWPTTIHLCLD
jgi:hypothetical protein